MTTAGDTTVCPNPTKSRYATKEAAEAAARRNQIGVGKLLYAYECDPACGWWHLTSSARTVATPTDIAEIHTMSEEQFQRLVLLDAQYRAPRVRALALRDPSTAHRWIAAIKAIQRDCNVQVLSKAGLADEETKQWRAGITALQQVLGDRRREAAAIIAVNPHSRALPSRSAGQKELRAAAGELAIRRLVSAHRDEFTRLLLEECARMGAEPPANAVAWQEAQESA